MSGDNVIISLDGHTEAFLNLKPWLPSRLHADFDDAMEEGERLFKLGNRYYCDMVATGADFAWESADKLVEVDADRYHQVLTADERLALIDEDGVAAEMLIDGFGAVTSDPKLQDEITMAYTRWFKDFTAPAPFRFTGALVVSLAAGIDVVVRQIEAAWEVGMRAVHLPPRPQLAHPDLPDFNHCMYNPVWQALNERSMAAIWHASVGREKPEWRWNGTERGWEALQMMDVETAHHHVLKYLLLSGVPERFPNLRIGFIESGSDWIPPILHHLDRFFLAPTTDPSHKLKMKPSEQWARQGFAAGPLDQNEVSKLDQLGAANLAFGSDYIHTEGTWPNTRRHLATILAGLSAAHQWDIVAGNAQRLLGFDIEKLAHTKAAQMNWRETVFKKTA
ncbi:amidohydrolase family protein [Paraburkholderia sp. MM5384-R2]|uniref:amidohydrolase family protein n=1 Tax=Paraburkholderia sp. MM5384-R2 TaxID=2723097 RepID=UPI00160F33F2|nr:amidohydrolase family protein [Paraburkholderia sp. MM5384-R2]MBB5498667.1 putative TIM-barrel fold metal-dependent hydrolase [Paraburkholderia sp. MM5384-R2]